MSITILCTGEPKHRVSGKYSSAGFDAAIQEEMNSGILPYNGRRYNPEGKTVWIGEGRLAQDTAEKLLLPCAPIVEPLLNEISLRSFDFQFLKICTNVAKPYNSIMKYY